MRQDETVSSVAYSPPFDSEAHCGQCNNKGAFDFTGNLLCAACASGNHEVEDESISIHTVTEVFKKLKKLKRGRAVISPLKTSGEFDYSKAEVAFKESTGQDIKIGME